MPPASSPPFTLPRGLILLASVWLVGGWLLTIGIRPPVHPSSATYEPAVRMMIFCVGLGLAVAWPLLRLTQPPVAWPIRATLLDAIVLVAMTQVVVWPLRLLTRWSPSRTFAIDLVLIAWIAAAAGIVALARGSTRPGLRSLAMSACLAGAILPALRGAPILSPLSAADALGDGGGAPLEPPERGQVLVVAVAAGVVWTGVLILGIMRGGGATERETTKAP